MAWFKEKVPFEEYWNGAIASFFSEPGATQEVFTILFPNFSPIKENSKDLMDSAGISKNDLLAFKVLCTVTSAYIGICVYNQSAASRFKAYLLGEGGNPLRALMSEYGMDPQLTIDAFNVHFDSKITEPISNEDSKSASWLEPIPKERSDLKLRVFLSSVGVSFFLGVCKEIFPTVYGQLSGDPLKSRDAFLNVVALYQRFDNHLFTNFRPV